MPKEVIWGQVVTVHDGDTSALTTRLERLTAARDLWRTRHNLAVRERDQALEHDRLTRAALDSLIKREDVLRRFINAHEGTADDPASPIDVDVVASLNAALDEIFVPAVPAPLPTSPLGRMGARVTRAMNETLRRVSGAPQASWETAIPTSAADAEPDPIHDTELANTELADAIDLTHVTEPEPDALPSAASAASADRQPADQRPTARQVQLHATLRWGRDERTVQLGIEAHDHDAGRALDLGGHWLDLDWIALNKLIGKARVARDQSCGKPE